MLVTSGLAHLPPIKVVTILSGVIGVEHLAVHRLGDHRARRPLPVPGLAAAGRYGEPIRHFIEKRLGLIAAAAAAALILLYMLVRYLH